MSSVNPASTTNPVPGLALLHGQVFIPPSLNSFNMDEYREFYLKDYPLYKRTASTSVCRFHLLLDDNVYTYLKDETGLDDAAFQALSDAEQTVHYEKIVAKEFETTYGVIEALKKVKMVNKNVLTDFLAFNAHFDYILHLAAHFTTAVIDEKTKCKHYLNGLIPRLRERVSGKEWIVIADLRKAVREVVKSLQTSAAMLNVDLNSLNKSSSTTAEDKSAKAVTQSVKVPNSSTLTSSYSGCRRCGSLSHKAFNCNLPKTVECTVCHQRGHNAAAHAKFNYGSVAAFGSRAFQSPVLPAPVAHSAVSLPSSSVPSAPFMTPTKVKPTHMRFSAEQARKMTMEELEAQHEENKQILQQLQAEAALLKEVKKEKRNIHLSQLVVSSAMTIPPAFDSEEVIVEDTSSSVAPLTVEKFAHAEVALHTIRSTRWNCLSSSKPAIGFATYPCVCSSRLYTFTCVCPLLFFGRRL